MCMSQGVCTSCTLPSKPPGTRKPSSPDLSQACKTMCPTCCFVKQKKMFTSHWLSTPKILALKIYACVFLKKVNAQTKLCKWKKGYDCNSSNKIQCFLVLMEYPEWVRSWTTSMWQDPQPPSPMRITLNYYVVPRYWTFQTGFGTATGPWAL